MPRHAHRLALTAVGAALVVGPMAVAASLLGLLPGEPARERARRAAPAADGAARPVAAASPAGAVAAAPPAALPSEAGSAPSAAPRARAWSETSPSPIRVGPAGSGDADPPEERWLEGTAAFDAAGAAAGPVLAEPTATLLALGAPIGTAPVLVAAGLAEPVFATGIPGDERVFLVERGGRIRILENGALRPDDFLDISSRTQPGVNDERGLLGLAFDPDHSWNGRFYVYYTDNAGDSVLARYRLGADPNRADASTEQVLLRLSQPASNHNGGTVAFGPLDGYLYLGLGDGGGTYDPQERAQDPQVLLGKILRLDVASGAGTPYGIPASNPFVGNAGVRDEIWALGLRNPYRFSFDWQTGDLWIGDVGQDTREEVDYEPAGSPGGVNYGWDVREGTVAAPTADVAQPPYVNAPFEEPLLDYGHVGAGCSGSITGGIVYRGPLASIQGEYFYGDFCRGQVWSYDLGSDTLTERTGELGAAAAPFQITAFGEDGFGAMYVVHIGGSVYRVGPTGSECSNGQDDDGDGAVDLSDTGCRDANDPSELDSRVACDDGYDNDFDGAIDFPADRDCPSSSSAGELPSGSGSGGGGGGGDGGGCGLGVELVLLVPLLRRRTRRD